MALLFKIFEIIFRFYLPSSFVNMHDLERSITWMFCFVFINLLIKEKEMEHEIFYTWEIGLNN